MDKIINLLINNWTKGVDTYTHNGSTWLIFTEQKSWVIELTESKTLWYNYNFFKELFSLTSMDVVENQHYITKWVEDNIINKVNYTSWGSTMNERFVGDVIEDGVKVIEDVKHTRNAATKDTIKYGVKETMFNQGHKRLTVKNIIENGVRHTLNTEYMPTSMVEDIIQSGVKETNSWDESIVGELNQNGLIDEIVENGIKETHDDAHNHKDRIDGVIKNGVKETKTPGKDGDILSTIEWMEENNSNSYSKMIDDVIDNGVKQTKPIGKESPNHPKVVINHIIQNGTKNPSV